MSKVCAVIQREYFTRVKKKSFIIITLLVPLGMLLLISIPAIMASVEIGTTKVCILDDSGLFKNRLEGTNRLILSEVTGDVEDWKVKYKDDYNALLHIPNFDLQYPGGVKIYSENQIGITNISNLERQIGRIIEQFRFENAGISKELVEKLRTRIRIENIVISKDQERSGNAGVAIGVGQIMGFFMYFIIFIYGSMIMKCVIDEKKNRIVEILISSIKPFDMMLGKIVGISLVAATQLLIWLVLGVIIFAFFFVSVIPQVQNINVEASIEMMEQVSRNDDYMTKIANFVQDPGALNVPLIIFAFCFYFLFGYLFYSTLFAAIGSVSDDEANAQLFTLPVSIPVILSMLIMFNVAQSPHSPMAIWASLIPFSSPIIMLARIPFGVPIWQIIISMICLVAFFIGSTWLSGKIYRTGILLYGKKLSWKDLWRFVKN